MSDRFNDVPLRDEPPDADPPPPASRSKARNKGPTVLPMRWHGETDPNADRAWLVRGLVFEVGRGLVSGQWGAGKTFVVLDLCASTMTGLPFAGRRVLRTGGVLFIAPEGAFEIPIRLRGLVEGKLRAAEADQDGREGFPRLDSLPFAWIEECPPLTKPGSAATLVATGKAAAEAMRDRFDVPLALVVIDTVAAASGFDDENSAAEAQKVVDAMGALSRETGAFVIGVDHFGKSVETGTRGSSAKEAGADVVLAVLANRDEAGTVSNTRIGVRKVRGARAGYEIPYQLEVVTVGQDRDGEDITTCIVQWPEGIGAQAAAKVRDPWTKSLRVLRDAIHNALASAGRPIRPFGSDGPEVRAARQEDVRTEFYSAYPADGDTPAQRTEAKKKAFKRSLLQGVENGLIVSRDVTGVPHLWLADPEPGD